MRDTRVWLAAGGLVVAVCAANLAGQVNPASVGVVPGVPQATSLPAPPPPLKPGAAAILGRIVEAGGNVGVAGAVVMLSGGALGRPDSAFTNGTPGGPRRVVADAQGQFVFRDLPPGSYNIDSTAAGYVDGAYGQKRIIQVRRTLDLIRYVQITESDRLVQTTIDMFRKGGITGRVVDEAGEPMVGISVSILARVTDWGGPITQLSHNATTDDRGQYHVDVVPGDYIVGVLAATTTVPVELVETFVSAQATGGAAFEAVVNQMVSLGGMLPRGVGTRIGSVRVSQFGIRNAPVVPPMSTEGGSWFYPSTYHPSSVSSMGASVVSIASGEEKNGVDLQLRPVTARRISGRIVGPDGPAGMYGIRLVSADPSVQRTSPAPMIDVPQAMADSDGAFVFIGVAPGAYTLYAIKRANTADQTTLWAAEPVSVSGSDLKDIEIRLKPGAPITGRVVFEGAPPTPDQMPSFVITPRGVPGSTAALTAAPSARPAPNGTFTMGPLVPGPYQMSMTTFASGWTLKSITTDGQNAVDKTFELTSSGINDMVVTFTDKRSVLTGLVRDGEGEAGTAATVAVFPTDRGLWRLPGMSSRRVQAAAPTRDGRFTFGGLPDGEYHVVAVDWPGADFSDPQVLTKAMPFASRVTIASGQTVTQDLKVTVIK